MESSSNKKFTIIYKTKETYSKKTPIEKRPFIEMMVDEEEL